jgi:hypothetical protein
MTTPSKKPGSSRFAISLRALPSRIAICAQGEIA